MDGVSGGKFRKKRVNFSMVSNEILRDNSISLKAKGLYSLIQSYVTLENFTLYKGFLMSCCAEGRKAFDSAWNELKTSGYLVQYRLQDEKSKKTAFKNQSFGRRNRAQCGVRRQACVFKTLCKKDGNVADRVS